MRRNGESGHIAAVARDCVKEESGHPAEDGPEGSLTVSLFDGALGGAIYQREDGGFSHSAPSVELFGRVKNWRMSKSRVEDTNKGSA